MSAPEPVPTSGAGPNVPGLLEADDPVPEGSVVGDNDSAVGTALASDSTSLMSSILKYRQENGRTYHAYKDGSYVLPNDDQEKDRLDLQHHLFSLTFDGKLYLAPLPKKLHTVLDAGTGTGIWAIDFADEHPEAKVVGVDLSPIQPSYVPPNVAFYVDDLEDRWTFTDNFDYIFARFMTGSISDWPKFFKNSFDHLNPGGVIEVQDVVYPCESDDDSVPKDSAIYRWTVMIAEGFERMKRPITSALKYRDQLETAGFTDIVCLKYKWPGNRWPRDAKHKELGMWVWENMQAGLAALSLAIFTRPKEEGGLAWTPEQLEALLVDVRKDLKNFSYHAYFPIYVYYAKKPE